VRVRLTQKYPMRHLFCFVASILSIPGEAAARQKPSVFCLRKTLTRFELTYKKSPYRRPSRIDRMSPKPAANGVRSSQA
jgi:hypothetical protein